MTQFWIRERGGPCNDLSAIPLEELKHYEGKRVRVALVYEGILERADYGNEFVIRDGCTRYLRRSHIEYIQEQK